MKIKPQCVPKNRVGEKSKDRLGRKLEIIEYKNAHDMEVKLFDGSIIHCTDYRHFSKGSVGFKLDRIGEKSISTHGQEMKIVKYENYSNIDVEFEDGYVFKGGKYSCFKSGNIKNPYFPSFNGMGFVGEGDYKTFENGKETTSFLKWIAMINRCYGLEKSNPTYERCKVCKEWLNFQNFAKWYTENFWHEDFDYLDKDILNPKNKEYSPQNCILVNNKINCFFTSRLKNKENLPIGISLTKEGKYRVDSFGYLGTFEKIEEATVKVIESKEKYVRELAEQYRCEYPQFPEKLYSRLTNFKLEDYLYEN